MRNTPKPTGPLRFDNICHTLTMEYPHMQDSDTSGSVGGGILKSWRFTSKCLTVSSETTTVDLLSSSSPPDLITVATLTMEYPHMQDSDTSGSVGGGILKAGDLRVNA
ncbi:hypothetical protein CEXT_149191 [Caerostris extrusa]|uniref:Uncharacterized protein n=1 Tax=Caerostris extrusa TaxID=172846 RepID=A0AAV4U7J3_CAEEX|nr:hypothetical protein CEXT_149191 [Caerostris extrusa]